jgi:hypothetical protein
MPMSTPVEQKVAKARDTQQALHDAIIGYQREHNCSREAAIDKVLYSRSVTDLVQAERQLAEVAKLAGGTLPQHRATTDIDFSNPLRGSAGYSTARDGRPPGRAHASGGPQSGEEDQPVIEDANDVLERLTKEGMRAGKSHAKAMSDAAMSPEFSAAHRKERARKYGA